MKLHAIFLFLSLMLIATVSAITIEDVNSPILFPGDEGELRISIENNLEEDADDVSLSLDLRGLPLSVVGTSEFSVDEIQEGDDDNFAFRLRASSTAESGDYQLPYTISYRVDNVLRTKTGVIGVKIEGSVDLQATISAENKIVGEEGTISIKIINRGFADARYVSVKIIPDNFLVNSEELVYIGDIDANDFETANFQVTFKGKDPIVEATIEYLDFNNVRKKQLLREFLTVYTQEEAIKQGIISPNRTPYYILAVVIIFVLWISYRSFKKYRRMKKSMQSA